MAVKTSYLVVGVGLSLDLFGGQLVAVKVLLAALCAAFRRGQGLDVGGVVTVSGVVREAAGCFVPENKGANCFLSLIYFLSTH